MQGGFIISVKSALLHTDSSYSLFVFYFGDTPYIDTYTAPLRDFTNDRSFPSHPLPAKDDLACASSFVHDQDFEQTPVVSSTHH